MERNESLGRVRSGPLLIITSREGDFYCPFFAYLADNNTWAGLRGASPILAFLAAVFLMSGPKSGEESRRIGTKRLRVANAPDD